MRDTLAAPLLLGLAGLIPFWALALLLPVATGFGLDKNGIDQALATYAAIIVSFLGGIRWGLASLKTEDEKLHFALSVVPSLVAWGALLLPEQWRLTVLGLVALGLGPIDALLVKEGLAPRWLGQLRLMLSTGAGVALLLGAFGFTSDT